MQQEEPQLTAAERELESSLKRIRPAESSVDPIAAAFEAGRKSQRRQLAGWRIVSGALAASIVAMMFVPAPPKPQVIVQPQQSVAEIPHSVTPARDIAGLANYFAIRDEILTGGLDALPATPPSRDENPPAVEQMWWQIHPVGGSS